MPRRGHREEHNSHPLSHDESNWLVSYADMMTLLFGFFVLMYSLSRIDHGKFDIVRKDLVKYFGGPLKENPGALNLKEKVETVIEQLSGREGAANSLVGLTISNNTVRMEFDSEFLYQSGSAELTLASAQLVDKVSAQLKELKVESIEVEGHTDADPIKSPIFPSNWELSSARASRIVRRMIENGLPGQIMTAKGLADSRPTVPHFDETGYPILENKVKNRRVIVTVALANEAIAEMSDLSSKGFKSVSQGEPHSNNFPPNPEPTPPESQNDIKQKLLDAQMRYEKAMERLKQAQEQERSIRDLESLTKKASDLERQIQNAEKKIEETISRTQKQMEKRAADDNNK